MIISDYGTKQATNTKRRYSLLNDMHVYYVTSTESILSGLWLALSDCKIEDQNINICLNATKSLV